MQVINVNAGRNLAIRFHRKAQGRSFLGFGCQISTDTKAMLRKILFAELAQLL